MPKKITHFIDFPQEVHPERMFVLNHIIGGVAYDVGCGWNKTLPTMIGVDPLPSTNLVGSAECLPITVDESVDLIVMRHSLEHVLNQVKAVKEWIRVLKVGGIVIVVLPDHGYIDTMDHRVGNGEHLHAYSGESFADFMVLFNRDLEFAVSPVTVIPDWSFGAVLKKRDRSTKWYTGQLSGQWRPK